MSQCQAQLGRRTCSLITPTISWQADSSCRLRRHGCKRAESRPCQQLHLRCKQSPALSYGILFCAGYRKSDLCRPVCCPEAMHQRVFILALSVYTTQDQFGNGQTVQLPAISTYLVKNRSVSSHNMPGLVIFQRMSMSICQYIYQRRTARPHVTSWRRVIFKANHRLTSLTTTGLPTS